MITNFTELVIFCAYYLITKKITFKVSSINKVHERNKL